MYIISKQTVINTDNCFLFRTEICFQDKDDKDKYLIKFYFCTDMAVSLAYEDIDTRDRDYLRIEKAIKKNEKFLDLDE